MCHWDDGLAGLSTVRIGPEETQGLKMPGKNVKKKTLALTRSDQREIKNYKRKK